MVVYHKGEFLARAEDGKQTTLPGVRKSGDRPDLCKMPIKVAVFPCARGCDP